MGNIKWGFGTGGNTDVRTGWVDVRSNCYLYFIYQIQPSGSCMLDTLTLPNKWDCVDLPFDSVQEAMNWAETHYALFKHEFKKTS